MAGRAPYRGPIHLDFEMHALEYEKNRVLGDYGGGIEDTFDGSHGPGFTYLPIVFEDDCQVAVARSVFRQDEDVFYEIAIEFLPSIANGEESDKG